MSKQSFEWERKWLPKDVNKLMDKLDKCDPVRISQVYITPNDRVRETYDFYTNIARYEHTHKVKWFSGGPSIENTSEITKEGFEKIAKAFPECRVDKLRRLVDIAPDYWIYIDHFSNVMLENDGYLLIEVEFKDQKTMKEFQVPDWFGEEVTNDPKYSSKEYMGWILKNIETNIE